MNELNFNQNYTINKFLAARAASTLTVLQLYTLLLFL